MYEPLLTAGEMRAAEERYPGYPETAGELMERAGAAVAHEALRAFPDARRFAVVCGGGSNGGDGRIAARMLREAGRDAEETDDPTGADVVVDALFGTGFHGAPRPDAARSIGRMNDCGRPVVAVDLPSGIDASTGEIAGQAVAADLTVTFHARKLGLVVAPGRSHAGEVVVADIGLEPTSAQAVRALPALLARVPRKQEGDSKFTTGTLLVVGGSPGTTSAPVLSARAAMRADAGYVTLAVPASCLAVAETLAIEPVKRGFEWHDVLETLAPELERAKAVAIGPGLGRSDEARELVRELLRRVAKPLVVDADGLFELEPVERDAPLVLTPHAGELARLLGRDSDWVGAHRLEAASECAERFRAVVLLKGADTIVRSPDGRTVISDHGPASLATAGTGDVLTGILGAFLAKGLEPVEAAAAAAVAHGLAGRAVAHQAGLVASDVVDALPSVLG